MLLVVGGLELAEFGAAFFFENGNGNWLFLGGPSLFYPTGFIPVIIGTGLIINVIASMARISFEKSNDVYTIEEHRFFLSFRTSIAREKIASCYLGTTKLGARLFWILPLGIHAWYLAVDAGHYLTNPFAFGNGLITGEFFLLQAIVDVVALILLVLLPQAHLEIHTTDRRYQLRFYPASIKPGNDVMARLSTFLDIGPARKNPAERVSREWWRLVAGITFIIVAIATRISRNLTGEPLQIALFLSGLVLVAKSVVEGPRLAAPAANPPGGASDAPITAESESRIYRAAISVQKWAVHDATVKLVPRNCDIFDYFVIAVIPALLVANLVVYGSLVPASYPGYSWEIAGSSLLCGMIAALLCMVYFKPVPVMHVTTAFAAYHFNFAGKGAASFPRMRVIPRISLMIAATLVALSILAAAVL